MASINVPEIRVENFFSQDPLAEPLWRYWLGDEVFAAHRDHLLNMGRAGALSVPLARISDDPGPVLQTHDARGVRVDRVVYHPAYHEMENLSYGGGVIAVKYEEPLLGKHRLHRHRVGFGGGFLFGQGEMGLYCPICMTDGVGRVLERNLPSSETAQRTIRHLATRDRARLWQGAMFLTEIQGGSDVGANTAEARNENGVWRLYGDKWFCSNVDAEAILALARMPGGAPGTKGLGLFLVLRHEPSDNGTKIRIHRLKDKLGVRSMPTGEVTLEGCEATLVGGEGSGFKMMAEMLNLSRLYNSVASVSCMRRAIFEAMAYGEGRRAFGCALTELPLWRVVMADLIAEYLGTLLLVFETVRSLDLADQGDENAARLVRILTPMAKALSGKAGIFTVSEAMEAIGANAYIEESTMPRLLRDAQVLPIWEGTTNILSLDMLRAMRKAGAGEALVARISAAIRAQKGEPAERLEAELARVSKELARAAKLSETDQQRESRGWLESAGRLLSKALLWEAAAKALELREVCLAALARLEKRPYAVSPVAQSAAAELQGTEEVLLRSAWRAK